MKTGTGIVVGAAIIALTLAGISYWNGEREDKIAEKMFEQSDQVFSSQVQMAKEASNQADPCVEKIADRRVGNTYQLQGEGNCLDNDILQAVNLKTGKVEVIMLREGETLGPAVVFFKVDKDGNLVETKRP